MLLQMAKFHSSERLNSIILGCVCVCVCIYMYVHTYIHIYIYTYIKHFLYSFVVDGVLGCCSHVFAIINIFSFLGTSMLFS